MSDMTPEKAAQLRAEFLPQQIGKLPRITCKDCRDAKWKACGQHLWLKPCPICHGSHQSAAIHLDYVGHAATTDRLLQVDSWWNWEPLALTPDGLPAPDRDGNLWIKLTICGVTRIGVGDGANAKERIGDAIRNAAMRFGVALDLWAKEGLTMPEPPPAPPASAEEAVERDRARRDRRLTERRGPNTIKAEVWDLLGEMYPDWTDEDRRTEIANACGVDSAAKATPDTLGVFAGTLNDLLDEKIRKAWKQ